eukprot:869765-Prorocentrum_minimum.AAC.1
MQEARAYSRDRPIGCRKRGYILVTDQSDSGSAGMFSRWTSRIQEATRFCDSWPVVVPPRLAVRGGQLPVRHGRM